MQPLDLKKFCWSRNNNNYAIVAITTFRDEDVVIFYNLDKAFVVEILTVDEFCREFEARYQINS